MMVRILIMALAVGVAPKAQAQALPNIPAAIYSDPAPDKAYPARMEVLHVPSGGVEINAVAYLASGKGAKPTLIICHGWPGNEKNLDLAQAVRRAGWNAITSNYRGSWGSPGSFRFAQNPEDAKAVLAFLRDPANSARLNVDTGQLVLAGHSMGGWVTAMVAAQDRDLAGAALISAANMGAREGAGRETLIQMAAQNAETLVGTSPERMADELLVQAESFDFLKVAPNLAKRKLLILSSDDGLAPQTDALAQAIHKAGGRSVTAEHIATDHSWSDKRIALQSRIIAWLSTLKSRAN